MQRFLAILLLCVIDFPLMPFTAVRPGISLPPCCRMNGKHKCALKEAALRHSSTPVGSAPLIAGIGERCPVRPALFTAVIGSHAFLLQPAQLQFGSLSIQSLRAAQAEALGRSAFGRTTRKRGPPALVLHENF